MQAWEKLAPGLESAYKPLYQMLIEQIKTDEQLKKGVLNEEKTLAQLERFILDSAREQLGNKNGFIPKEEVLSMAIHYFTESNEDLKLSSKKTTAAVSKTKETKVEPLTLFDFMEDEEQE